MVFDVFILAFCIYGYLRGRRHRFSGEVYRLIRTLVALGTGLTLVQLISQGIATVTGEGLSRPVSFLLGFFIPFGLAWVLRRRLEGWLRGVMVKDTQKKWGAIVADRGRSWPIVGGVRSVCMASALVIAASLGSGGVFQNALTKGLPQSTSFG